MSAIGVDCSWLWLWLWLYVSVSTGPYHATSTVAPAPCAANAAVPRTSVRRNLLSLDPFSSPFTRLRYDVIPPSLALGVVCWGPAP